MGLYKNNNGVLIPIAGRGKAEYGASTTRRNTWTNSEAINPDSSIAFSVSFDVPMPDDTYEIDWTCSASALHPVVEEKTASGFTGHAYRLISPAVDVGDGIINFTAFKLYTDLEYDELLDDTFGLTKNTSKMGAVNQFETTIHSQRYNKVVYTVNDDGTIALEILQRPETNTGLSIGFIDVKAGETYKLTGGLSANERLELRNMDYSTWTNNTVNKAVSSPIVDTNIDTFMPNADATLRVQLRIDASGNIGNVGTIEPMIRFASLLDDTFIPYAKTNRLLTVETDELFANAAMLKGMTAISSQTDLNDVTTIGNYYKSSTSIYVTNAPTGIDSETSAIFRLNVENGSDSTDKYIQTIIKNDGTTYKRGYDGTNWSSWIEFASSATVSGINTRLTTAETDIDNLESSRLKTYTSDATAWDTEPTASSTKPVTSGGVKTQLDLVHDELSDVNNILGSKNILPNSATTQVINGITYTVAADGSINANGTATADSILHIVPGTTGKLSNIFSKGGNYIISVGTTGTGVNVFFGIEYTGSTWDIAEWLTYSTRLSKEIYIDGTKLNNSSSYIECYIKVNSGTTVSNIKVYPMLRPANIKDASYVPYAMTNRDLTSQISNFADSLLSRNIGFNTYGATFYNIPTWSLVRSGNVIKAYIGINVVSPNSAGWELCELVENGSAIRPTSEQLFTAVGNDGKNYLMRFKTNGRLMTDSGLPIQYYFVDTLFVI